MAACSDSRPSAEAQAGPVAPAGPGGRPTASAREAALARLVTALRQGTGAPLPALDRPAGHGSGTAIGGRPAAPPPIDPVAAWAASGAMWLTGHAGGPPLAPAAAVVPALEAAAEVVSRLAAARGAGVVVDVGALLTGRAALLGWARRGRTSANGTCRLLAAADGWVAVNLARPNDHDAVAALVEAPVAGDPWAALARAAARRPAGELVERAILLGVPAAALPSGGPGSAPPARHAPFSFHRVGPARADPAGGAPASGPSTRSTRSARRPLVVDLSAMWAGPLCAHLLGRAGLRVVKVESRGRPDGARSGHPGFFAWLHAGHESVTLDLASTSGRAALQQLLCHADVVIESSRPRALAQLGVDPRAVAADRPGLTWVSITGHGRDGEAGQRVAFGDDAAVAAGLVARDDEGQPVFCGDAIADPVTGLHAAAAALASLAGGGGLLVDAPLAGVAAAIAREPAPPAAAHRVAGDRWAVRTATGTHPVAPPRSPPPSDLATPARPPGADTAAVLAEVSATAGAGPPC